MTPKQELLKELIAHIEEDPDIVPEALKAISKGMAAWEAKVQRRLDHRADYGISAALMLPKARSFWDVHNARHRAVAIRFVIRRRTRTGRASTVPLSGAGIQPSFSCVLGPGRRATGKSRTSRLTAQLVQRRVT